jgi:hypothetical protein
LYEDVLKDLGLTRDRANRWQLAARCPDEKFRELVESHRVYLGPITLELLVSLGREQIKLDKLIKHNYGEALERQESEQKDGELKKLVEEGAPIPHAVQTVVDQYGKPIEPEDVTEDVGQPADEQPRVYDHGRAFDIGMQLASDLESLERWVQHSPEELANGLRAVGKVRQARASLDKTILALRELENLLQRRGG